MREAPDPEHEPSAQVEEETVEVKHNDAKAPSTAADVTATKKKKKPKPVVRLCHSDIIGDAFWAERPNLLDE